jgi:hypothetical protein
MKTGYCRVVRIPIGGKPEVALQHMIGAPAKRLPHQLIRSAKKKSGAGKQDQSEGKLANDQEVSDSAMAETGCYPSRAAF